MPPAVYLQEVPLREFPGTPGRGVTNAELLDWALGNWRAAVQSNRDKAAIRDWAASAAND